MSNNMLAGLVPPSVLTSIGTLASKISDYLDRASSAAKLEYFNRVLNIAVQYECDADVVETLKSKIRNLVSKLSKENID